MITTISNKNLNVEINSKGAELVSLSKDNLNYIWEIDKKYWNKTSPVLFPIVGSLRNNEYCINDTKYALTRHGFARDYEFKIIEQNKTSVLFCFESNDSTFIYYPFHFKLFISYEIHNNVLIISYKVFNQSKVKLPFNIGAHPAFNIPFNINEYSLEFNKTESFKSHKLTNGLLSEETKIIKNTNNTISLSDNLFKEDALIFKNIKSDTLKLIHLKKDYVKISFYNFPHLGIWKKRNAPFICIEPWTGYSDSINCNGEIFKKESIQILNPNSSFESKIEIAL